MARRAQAGDEAGLAVVEGRVDLATAGLWGITEVELQEIRRSLEELGRSARGARPMACAVCGVT